MTKKEKFSIWNDPSFSGHSKEWWEEWRKNQDKIPKGTPPPICKECLFWEDDGTWQGKCIVLGIDQGSKINCGECEKKYP